MTRLLTAAALALVTVVAVCVTSGAQSASAPPAAARASAPIDLTGYWVSYVTEDWRYRMVTPPRGDYRGVPITREALALVNAWDPAADEKSGNQCRSYGAAAIMRVPGRFHITWQDENTLRVDSDAGMQTRLFRFAPARTPAGPPTWQGLSTATWRRAAGAATASPWARGSLTVVTTNMKAGYLRKNGVPYSADASVTEHFDLATPAGGTPLLVVTTVVDDPRYLLQPFIVSSHFKKELDGSKWDPAPCSATW